MAHEIKDFIYLDTSFLHSFVAQVHSGLPTTTSTEFQESETKTSTEGAVKRNFGEVGGQAGTNEGILGLLPTVNISGKLTSQRETSDTISLTQLDAGKEIISKQLHDNVLHDFIHYLNEYQMLVDQNKEDHPEVGRYIQFRSCFKVIDFNMLMTMTDRDFITYIMSMDSSKLKGAEKQQHQFMIKSVESGIELFNKAITYVTSLLPTSTYIKMDNLILPLKSEFIRINTKELAFKYGMESSSQITVLGKITRRYESFWEFTSSNPTMGPLIGGVSEALENVLDTLDFLSYGDYIATPIAIYFE
jgi:mRNA-degrading endonuclease YafQ of YafQ-DinJ toxin-antitoxin module